MVKREVSTVHAVHVPERMLTLRTPNSPDKCPTRVLGAELKAALPYPQQGLVGSAILLRASPESPG